MANIAFTSQITISGVTGLEVFGVSSQVILSGSSSNGLFYVEYAEVVCRSLLFQNGYTVRMMCWAVFIFSFAPFEELTYLNQFLCSELRLNDYATNIAFLVSAFDS